MKRVKETILVFCFVLLAALLHAQNQKPAVPEAGNPKMEIPQQVFDAGTLYRSNNKIEHAFVIKNTGKADLKILSATPG